MNILSLYIIVLIKLVQIIVIIINYVKHIKKIKCSNFSVLPKRNIKYVIIHYTNMNNQKSAIKRLQSRVAKVSCHYIVSKRVKFIGW